MTSKLHAPAALSTERELVIPTQKEAGWAPEPVWTYRRRKKKPFILPGKELRLLGRPALSLVTMPNMLSLLPKQVSGNTTV